MTVVEEVRFKISNKNIRMYGVSQSTPLKLNQMIIIKGQKTRPVELVKKYPKYECLKFDTLGQAAKFLGVESSYLKSYLDEGVEYMGKYGYYIHEQERPREPENINALF